MLSLRSSSQSLSRALSSTTATHGQEQPPQRVAPVGLRLSMYDFLGTDAGAGAPRRRRVAPVAPSASASTSLAAPASRDETLAAARAERERRARLKAEAGAALRIQVRVFSGREKERETEIERASDWKKPSQPSPSTFFLFQKTTPVLLARQARRRTG